MTPKLWYATILFMQLTIACLFALVLVTLSSHQSQASQTSIMPVKGDKGDTAQVDYERIDAMLTEKVAQMSTPAASAQPEAVDYGKVSQIVKEEVAKVPIIPGPQGAPGAIAEQRFEQRANPFTLDIEWRCVGDAGWYGLRFIPLLKDSCV